MRSPGPPPAAKSAEVKAAEILAAAIDRLTEAIKEPEPMTNNLADMWQELKRWLQDQDDLNDHNLGEVLMKMEDLESEHT